MENLTLNSTDGNLVYAKSTVTFNTAVEIAGEGELPIKIIADFTDIPKDKHEMFFQAFKTMYNIKF
jgi:hypothetical protein